MVYDFYDSPTTNREFIENSYKLLGKLSDKKLWNKDTLIIGLDKSVRPLAYTLRKISKKEGRETPEIRYFNYSNHDYTTNQENIPLEGEIENISSVISDKIKNKNLERYKKIVILDEGALSGKTIINAKKIFEKVFPNSKVSQAVMFNPNPEKLNQDDLIYVNNDSFTQAEDYETGIEDKKEGDYFLTSGSLLKPDNQKSLRKYLKKSGWDEKAIEDFIKVSKEPLKEKYSKFFQNRRKLSRDIDSYLIEKNPNVVLKKSRTLERVVSGIFIFSFFGGLLLSSGSITGNVIGNFGQPLNLTGIFLMLFGLTGFFIQRILKKRRLK